MYHATGTVLGHISIGVKTNEISRFEDLPNTIKNLKKRGGDGRCDAHQPLPREIAPQPWIYLS